MLNSAIIIIYLCKEVNTIMNEMEMCELFSASFPFFDKINDVERATLLRSSQYVRFKRGTNIHDGGECTGVILIKSGTLRVYIISEDGKEITLYRLFAGEICILSASCVLDTVTFDVLIDAEENSECVVVGGCAFEDIARRLPEVKIFSLEAALSRFSDVMWVMQQILFQNPQIAAGSHIKACELIIAAIQIAQCGANTKVNTCKLI